MNEALVQSLANGDADVYDGLAAASRALFEGERDFIANSANLSALLYHTLPQVNWCGLYLLRDRELVLGPFQGKIACVRIPLGRGVCGASAREVRTIVVPDVEEFPGHIACDADSRSEIVVPLVRDGRLVGVLDIDSPVRDRFGARDAAGLEAIARILLEASDLPA